MIPSYSFRRFLPRTKSLRALGTVAGTCVLIITLCVAIWMLVPPSSSFLTPPIADSTRVTDREGRLLYEARPEDGGVRESIPLSAIPPVIIDALTSTEDRTFFTHHGVSLRGIARAIRSNVQAGGIREGGSTITQQLVRNLVQPSRRTFLYKAYEAMVAIKLDLHLSKDEILETYLNTAYFGHRAYGIDAAARTYFDRRPTELSLGESALLVGLLQSPSGKDPYVYPDRARERQKIVLAALRETGRINETQEQDAAAEPLRLRPDRIEIQAPHFVFFVLDEHEERLPNGGELRTTLDLPLQQGIERIVQSKLALLENKNVTSAAVVVLNSVTGDVLAMVGSANYFDEEHDGAVNVALSARQPGSALKPFTYALALMRGDTAATTVEDIEAQFFTESGLPYIPRNYDYGEHGLVRYREALANSYNIAAVKVLERIGVERLLTFLRAAGLSTLTKEPAHYGLALTLGAGEVRLLELAQAYGIFAREGRTLSSHTLLADTSPEGERILDPQVAWLISDILSDDDARLAEFGEGGPLSFSFPVAAKTGTTRNSRDNWVMGYAPDRIVGVWVGNADNSPMKGTSGVTGAGPIFHDVMELASEDTSRRDFARPPGMTEKEVCRLSGLLPTPLCPSVMRETFAAGTEPTQLDTLYRSLKIDTRNGLLAGDTCPAEITTERVFAVFPPSLGPWARSAGYPAAPLTFSPLCPGTQDEDEPGLSIRRPRQNESLRLDPLIPDALERMIFEATATSDVTKAEWFINGASIGTGEAPIFRMEWQPKEGTWTVEVRSGTLYDRVTIEVVR